MQKSDSGIKGLILSIRPEDDSDFDKWLEESQLLGVVGYRRTLHVLPDEVSQQDNYKANVKKIGKAGMPCTIKAIYEVIEEEENGEEN